MGCVVAINSPLTTTINLDCCGDFSHVNWWICETEESVKKKTQLGWSRLGSIDSTVGKYFGLDKIICTYNLNLISGFFRAFAFGIANAICKRILALMRQISPASGLLLVKFFKMPLQYHLTSKTIL